MVRQIGTWGLIGGCSRLRHSIADGTTTTATTKFIVSPEAKGETTVAMSGLRSLEVKSVLGPARNRGGLLSSSTNERAMAVPVRAPGE